MSGCGFKRLGLAILLVGLGTMPAAAGSGEAFASMGSAAAAVSADTGIRLAAHFRKVYSFYCYPKSYWWFYRPYTTGQQNYARCMPYFHYLDEAYPAPRNLRQGEPIK
ncbi:MAG: hypothetical protein ACM3MH_01320 [Actinomycetota bacterium]